METKNLILRKLTHEDAYDIFINIHHDKEVLKTFLARYVEKFEDFEFDKLLAYFENKSFYYGIELKKTHECIGMIFENDRHQDEIEIGYAISSKYWNQGYVSESLKAVIDELIKRDDCHRISAAAFKENKASLRVMEKCGMKYSHTIENEIEWQGKAHDVVYYELLKENENV